MNTGEEQTQAKISKVIAIMLRFTTQTLVSLGDDFGKLFKRRRFWFFRKIHKQNHFKLLSTAQSDYLKNQAKLSFLHNRWKFLLKEKIEAENTYYSLITLIDKESEEPINSEDQNLYLKVPTFNDDEVHQYAMLKEGNVAQSVLDPPIYGLAVPSKIIARILNIVNKLSYDHFSRLIKEITQFRVFPEQVSDNSNYQQRDGVKTKNILASITTLWVAVILVAYFSALSAEIIVFESIARNLLGIDRFKSWLFALTILGVSFMLGLHFFDHIKLFLRTKGHTPIVLKVYIIAIVLYVLATGFLNFEQYQYRKLEGRYQIELSNLSTLQMTAFTNPEDQGIQSDLQKQEQKIEQIEIALSTPSGFANFLARLLYILAGFIALLTSALLLAVKLTVSKVLKYKHKYQRCNRQIVTVKTDYQHYLSVHRKAREILWDYLFQLGRYQALECLQVMNPTGAELMSMEGTDSFEHIEDIIDEIRGESTLEQIENVFESSPSEPKNSEIEVDEPGQPILTEEEYKELYQS